MNEKVGRWRSNWEEDVEEEKRWQRKSKSIMKRFLILMVVFLHSTRQIILKCPLFVSKQLHLAGHLVCPRKAQTNVRHLCKMHLVQFITKDIKVKS